MDNRYDIIKGEFEESILKVTAKEVEDMRLESLKGNLELFNNEDYATVIEQIKWGIKDEFKDRKVAKEMFSVIENLLDYEYILERMIQQLENRIKELEGKESNEDN